jgi:anti-sigma B factor antagonist
MEDQMSFFYISEGVTAEGVDCGDDVAVLLAGGELDYEASPRLRERIGEHIKAGKRLLVLDLSAASFIDSTVIGVLVGAAARLREASDGSLAIVCADENERVLRIFEISGASSSITLHRSLEEALSASAMAG